MTHHQPNDYYVYLAKVDGTIKYIGKGRGNRIKHCSSGKSHCFGLNQAFFSGKEIATEIIDDNLTALEALRKEAEVINDHKDGELFNTQIPSRKKTDPRFLVWATYVHDLTSAIKQNEHLHVSDANELLADTKTELPIWFLGIRQPKLILPLLGFVKTTVRKKTLLAKRPCAIKR